MLHPFELLLVTEELSDLLAFDHSSSKGISSREAARGHATNVDGIVLSVTINRIYNLLIS